MITEEEWLAFMNDLQQTLDKFGVPQPEQNEIKAIVESTHEAIVVAASGRAKHLRCSLRTAEDFYTSMRPPATETGHAAGLCLGLPDALHVGQVDHRFPRAGLRDAGPALFPCSTRAALR
jgi:hypothetical protein